MSFLGNFGKESEPEEPREVYIAVCEEISNSLSGDGFKFAKSGPRCRKRAGELVYTIYFGTSRYNMTGTRVALTASGIVSSPKLGKWRSKEPCLNQTDSIAGGQIGNMKLNHEWIEWNIADPATRRARIQEISMRIRELALPYFSQFENTEEMFQRLISQDIPCTFLVNVIHFLLCFGSKDLARRAIEGYFARHPDQIPAYQLELAKLKGEDLREVGVTNSSAAYQAAFNILLFELGDLRV